MEKIKDIEIAKQKLKSADYTCVIVKGSKAVVSTENGIKPLLSRLGSGVSDLEDASVADRVIGKSAAFLLVKGKIKELYAQVLSAHAQKVLMDHSIPYTYGELVPYIINRAGDGMCPMEESVLEIKDPEAAYQILCEKVKQMMKAQ